MTLAADLAALLADAVDLGLADAATYTPVSGASVAVVAALAELADDLAQRPAGHDRVRLADALIDRAALGAITPAHGDTLAVASGAQAGTWIVLGIERRDAVALVLRVRRSDRVDAATTGAREVRR
jgi:hypothetical protein